MNNVFYERTTECPDGWWLKGKRYPLLHCLGTPFIIDEDGYKLPLTSAVDRDYIHDNFKKVVAR